MILVIADDFSGAAEMAGIGFRYGLQARVAFEFEPRQDHELLVVNTGTRSMSEQDAKKKLHYLADAIKKFSSTPLIFKKVDSVFRGHIAAEIEVLMNQLNYKRAILLPANPSKNRTIENGKYLVQGEEIQNTIFAEDPAFPTLSPKVKALVNSENYGLRHFHLVNEETIPAEGLVTGDLKHNDDFTPFLNDLNPDDLAVGAADFFEHFLLKYLDSSANKSKGIINRPLKVIIHGSTVSAHDEDQYLQKQGLPVFNLPGAVTGHEFILSKQDFLKFCRQLKESLLQYKLIKICVGQPISREPEVSKQFLTCLRDISTFLVQELDRSQLQLFLTGGETASAILESLKISTLEVKAEVSPGTVTLEGEKLMVTTKPGSYAWPLELFKFD